jgi:two-component system, chemotaxis family, protein-glutamate methylesterase/glutaminase
MLSSDGRRMRRSRVLIVDDSDLMRDLLTEIIEETDDFKVVGQARTGLEAIRLIHQLNPDVITLDIEMPDLNGLETLGYIMSETPRPVVIVSSHTRSIVGAAIQAYDFGALEIVPKPAGDERRDVAVLRDRLLDALTAANAADLRNLAPHVTSASRRARRKPEAHDTARCAIAIAASTGGPRALTEILPRLPADLPCAVLVVQHMPPSFTEALANRLDELSELPVHHAQDDEPVEAGVIYIAPGGKHLGLQRKREQILIQLNDDDPVWGVRPAADVLFRDVAKHFGPASAGLVLTGMGRDGAEGLRHIQEVGGWTAVQDEDTAVIYGMPRNAAPFASEHLALDEIAETLVTTGQEVCRRR